MGGKTVSFTRSHKDARRPAGGHKRAASTSRARPFQAGTSRAAAFGTAVRQAKTPQRAQKPSAPDLLFLLAMLCLVSMGTVMVYSATALETGTGQLMRTAVFVGIGAVGCVVAAHLPMKFWRKLAPWMLAASVVLLTSLLVGGNPLAQTSNGATRWIRLPGGQTFQPSELAKLSFVLFAAHLLERKKRLKRDDWLVFLGVLAVLAFLIYKEPDLGTTLVLGGTAFCMLIAAEVDWRTLGAMAGVAIVVVAAAAWSTPHQRQRLLTWMDPWKEEYRFSGGMQTVMSIDAMARGGLTGVGLGNSLGKVNNRVPEAETDFIFAIVAEELGLVGAVSVLLFFAVFAVRGFAIAARAPDRYSALVAVGITSWVAVQACLNIAVATGTVPNTGVPLPFISSGGTSLVTLMTASGIVLGISRHRRQKQSRA